MADNVILKAIQLLKEAQEQGIDLNDLQQGIQEAENAEKTKDLSYWSNGQRSTKYVDFEEFLNKRFPNSKKDIFRNVVFTKDIDQFKGWSPIENHKKTIESLAHDCGLQKSFTDAHLARWCNNKRPELLVEVPKWDGKDHIKDALDRITVTNIEHDYFVELMKDWFSKIVRRMQSPKVQNRLPVFRGRQGLGKDFSIRAMTSGFGSYANEIDFQQSNKTEVYRVIKNLAVGIIPEFDETNSSSISVLKSVITAESIELRALYKNESESIPIRTSFISASNFEDVLRDSSGNRRFMIFDLEDLEHTFDKVDGQQIAAQCFALAKEKYSPSKEAEKAMLEIINRETPESPSSLFLEEVNELLKRKSAEIERDRFDSYAGKIEAGSENIPEKLRWHYIADDVTRITKRYRFGVKRAQQIMQRAGMTSRDNKSTYYLPI